MEAPTTQMQTARPPTIPVPRNRRRSGSAQPPSASPPLRSIVEIRPGNTISSASLAGNMDIGDRNVSFAPPPSDVRKDVLAGGSDNQTPGGSKVPAFLNKLFSMINDTATDTLIYWATDGASFFIPNTQDFGRELLPQFFKHANFTSFVRQLNMYGFKKVPHLQTGTLNTFPQPTNELWEFSNPKFHRDHPDWLAGITRKKSAKELAAAAALAAQGQGSNQAEGSGHDDVAGKTKGNQQTQGQVPSSTEAQPGPTNQIGKDAVDSQSLNKAMTLMKDTHISLERELSELKASNEMLWRQAMLSREEQLKSQKKLDSVMRFLAGQFGSMNMSLLEDEGDNLPSTSGTQPTRIARFGKGRMIGDGINGVEGNASDEDMDEETDLWETGDHEESRQFWEVDDSGKMIKVPQPRVERQNSTGRPLLARTATPTRPNFNLGRVPGSQRKMDSSPSKRFERLDGSPEEIARMSFETPPKSGSSDTASPITVNSVDPSTRLFPPLQSSNANLGQGGDRGNLQPHANNTVALHNPAVTQLNNGQYTLDPSILNLPLGTLLSTPAGAQFLATLGQSAASFLGQPSPVPTSPRQRAAPIQGSRFSDATVGSIIHGGASNAQEVSRDEHAAETTDATMTGMEGDTSWMSSTIPQAEGLPDHLAQPFLNSAMPNVDINDTQDAGLLADANTLSQEVDFDWSDPAVKALLQAFESQNQPQAQSGEQSTVVLVVVGEDVRFDGRLFPRLCLGEQSTVEPNVFTNDDQYDELFQDPVIDFNGMFTNHSNEPTPPGVETATPSNPSAANSNAGDVADVMNMDRPGAALSASVTDELFAGPTRKKRKTDQREP